jgi:hypothetical protein
MCVRTAPAFDAAAGICHERTEVRGRDSRELRRHQHVSFILNLDDRRQPIDRMPCQLCDFGQRNDDPRLELAQQICLHVEQQGEARLSTAILVAVDRELSH